MSGGWSVRRQTFSMGLKCGIIWEEFGSFKGDGDHRFAGTETVFVVDLLSDLL